MIIKLRNPLTDTYLSFKEFVTSEHFTWHHSKTFEGTPSTPISIPEGWNKEDFGIHTVFGHNILSRPEPRRYSAPYSDHIDSLTIMYNELVQTGQVENESFFLRSCVNLTTPWNRIGPRYSYPHTDHSFDHINMIMYLTDAGGRTFVEGEGFDPKEDDIILFKGLHWSELPEAKDRIVVVSTLITWEE